MAVGDDNVVPLPNPNWKKNATPHERLSELAAIAKEHPERFTDYIVVYRETTPRGTWKYRILGPDATDLQAQMGLLQAGMQVAWTEST